MINWIYKILIVCSIICLLIILQIIFEFVSINPFDWDNEKIYQVNNTLIGICTGIITGSIIYFITVGLTDFHRRKKVLNIAKPFIQTIYFYLKRSEAFLLWKYDVSDLGKCVCSPAFSYLDNQRIFLVERITSKGKNSCSFTELKFWIEERDTVCGNIDAILSILNNQSIQDLHDSLILLRQCLFYIGVQQNKQCQNPVLGFSRIEFEKEQQEYVGIISNLLRKFSEYYKEFPEYIFNIV